MDYSPSVEIGDIERLPPQSLEAEQSLLGSMLISTDAIHEVADFLKSEDFYRESHRKIYEGILRLYALSEPVDPITLVEQLKTMGSLEAVGGAPYIHTLVNIVPTAANARHYAKIVERASVMRSLIRAGTEIVGLGYEDPEDPAESLNRAESVIFQLGRQRSSDMFAPIKDVLHETMEHVEEVYAHGAKVTGLATGFPDLDAKLSGLQPSDLCILAARPSMGKTSLALNIAQNVGLMGKAVAVFSLEMPKQQLAQRMLCAEARVDAHDLRTGNLTENDWDKLVTAVGRLAEVQLFIDDTASISIMEMRAKARRLAAKHPLSLIVIDYLQLMQGGNSRRQENRQQEISEISRALKVLGRELRVPIIALSQLSRAVESRENKRPQLSDLRECVTGDTLVTLADGRRRPIKDLVGTEPEVLSMSSGGKIVTAKSDKVWHVGLRPVYKVSLASGRSLRATGKHRLFGSGGWVRVQELAAGDRLAIARSLPQPPNDLRWPDQHIGLLAQLIGDGSYLSGQPMRYTTSSEQNSAYVSDAASQGFGCKVTRYAGRGNWHQLLISGNGNRWRPEGVNRWLRDLGVFGQRSHEKRVPADIFCLDNEQVALFLRHIWATDGHLSVRRQDSRGSHASVFFSTNSHGLAQDVASLLLRFGIVGRIKTVEHHKYRSWYNVHVSGAQQQLRFIESVGAFGEKEDAAEQIKIRLSDVAANTNVDTVPTEIFGEVKRQMAAQGITQRKMASLRGTSYGGTSHFSFSPSRSVVADYATILNSEELMTRASDDLFWDEVIDIAPVGEEDVFDLTVPGTECWLADSIISHNSGAIEQDADIVMFIYRDDYYNEESDDRGKAEIIVAKHRNGPTGKVDLTFLARHARFGSLARG